ncbi:hypothetical protein I6A60_24745 [Frankia sp. AgB1.9]|uniref:hypothetical protein n=1 Tax=Frankia sp. AgB1.8 TaxID=2792839 RepID=UPI001933257D|nr:hypothetical protein [Frankia sp. AgB1.8]MBL7487433.1 hypothetical protein [Frankia sp. AgW1.1]MBL7551049.1 hypothetical protein [Frankia sp. AgB1.9]MBL7618830.1 hypothetical protein [Frankia sp. AgB1.8]
MSGGSSAELLVGRHVRRLFGGSGGRSAGARPRRSAVGLLVCLVVLLLALLDGCGRPPKDVTAVVGVTATSAEPAPALSDALAATLRAEADRSQKPGVPDARLVQLGRAPADVDLTPMRGGDVENDSTERVKLIDAAFGKLSAGLASRAATREQLDVLDTLRAVAEAGSGPIYLLTSGVSTVDPVNLASLGWTFDAKAVAADLRRRDLLPHLGGRSVTFVGLGRVAGAQPALDQPEEVQVKALWLAICEAAGAAHCAVDDSSVVTAAPVATDVVSVVPVPRRHGTMTVAPPSDVLFGPDSAVLLPGADVPLCGLADQLIACDAGARVDNTGHVADVVQRRAGARRDRQPRRRRPAVQRCRTRHFRLGAPPAEDTFADTRRSLIEVGALS